MVDRTAVVDVSEFITDIVYQTNKRITLRVSVLIFGRYSNVKLNIIT